MTCFSLQPLLACPVDEKRGVGTPGDRVEPTFVDRPRLPCTWSTHREKEHASPSWLCRLCYVDAAVWPISPSYSNSKLSSFFLPCMHDLLGEQVVELMYECFAFIETHAKKLSSLLRARVRQLPGTQRMGWRLPTQKSMLY